MRKGIYILASLILVACSEVDDIDSNTDIPDFESELTDTIGSTQRENVRVQRDSVVSLEAIAPSEIETYSALWFRIDYPQDFAPAPTGPKAFYGDYEYVTTDEATFTSPDGTVEFFIFSPQWRGDPIDYLEEKPSEKTVESKVETTKGNEYYTATHTWKTFEDIEGKYTRAYHSIKTESTHHVFGVKYTNRKMYERYKAAYMAFKQSLQQFAD